MGKKQHRHRMNRKWKEKRAKGTRQQRRIKRKEQAVNLHGSPGEPFAYACKRVRFCRVPFRNIHMQPIVKPKIWGVDETAYESAFTGTKAYSQTSRFTQLSYHYTPNPLKSGNMIFHSPRCRYTCICKQLWVTKSLWSKKNQMQSNQKRKYTTFFPSVLKGFRPRPSPALPCINSHSS